MVYETIRVVRDGPRATLILSRPDRHNGITARMLEETYTALSSLADDRAVRVVVVTGSGTTFCPGADLGPGTSRRSSHDQWLNSYDVPMLLQEMEPVTVAAINGGCAGAGLGWAAACDLRYATSSARFNTAFLNVGVAGDMGLPWTLGRLVGPALARELSFFPQKFSAERALEIGVVNAVFDPKAFEQEVSDRVARLLTYSEDALRLLKRNYVASERLALRDFLSLETARHLELLSRPNTKKALDGFTRDTTPPMP